MGTDEQILRSFLADGEDLLDSWQVGTVGRGFHRPPLGPSDEVVVGVTNRRLLWFDEELGSAARDDVGDLDRGAVDRMLAPRVVLAGGAALVVGVAASLAALLFSAPSLPELAAPAGIGAALLAGSLALARIRGQSGTGRSFPYLQIHVSGGLVTVWGEEAVLADIETALAERGDAGRETDGDEN